MIDVDLDKYDNLGLDLKADLEKLLQECRRNLPKFDEKMIRKAFQWCANVHKNQRRKSGEPYYTHPLNVAMIIAKEMPLDDISIAAALLHEVTRHSNKYSIKDMHSEFGPTVAEIVDAVQKIHHVENHNIEELDNYRRLLLSLFKDVRIILIKLADRLHNMRTLQYLDKTKQEKMAVETLEIYSPFAHRFGLGNIKWELEDQAFKVLHYDTYKNIRQAVQLSRKEREDYLNEFINPIREKLNADEFFKFQKVDFDIKGRAKHLYSIYNKTILRNKPVEDLYDLFAIRVIIDTDNHHLCYVVLSIISDIYETMPGTYKNYIANPKQNGYQSIHIAFFGKDNKPVEVQIRTKQMDQIAEKGLAAHFNYKSGLLPAQSVIKNENVEEWLDQIRGIFETMGDQPSDKLIESVRRTLLFDEIYVFTPANEFRTFPKDSTALDFAYGIHTEIGHQCIGAKVNGRVVPIDYKLQSGDVVEILTSKSRKPSVQWLSFIVTAKARNAIHKFIKDEKKQQVSIGKNIWRKALDENSIEMSLYELRRVVEHFHFHQSDEFYTSLADGSIHIQQVLSIIRQVIDNRSNQIDGNNRTIKPVDAIDFNLPVNLGQCCYPLPGDSIIGEIHPGTEIIVHRNECLVASQVNGSHESAAIRINWTDIKVSKYITKLILRCNNNPEINAKITAEVLDYKSIKIRGFNFTNRKGELICELTLAFTLMEEVKNLTEKLQNLPGVLSIDRFIKP